MVDRRPERGGVGVAERGRRGTIAIDGALLFVAIASAFFATVLPAVSPAMLLCGAAQWPLSYSVAKIAAQAVLVASFVLLVVRARSRGTAIPGDQWALVGTGAGFTLFSFAGTSLLLLGHAERTACLGSVLQAVALMTALSVLPGIAIVVDAISQVLARGKRRRRAPGVASAIALAALIVGVLVYISERG